MKLYQFSQSFQVHSRVNMTVYIKIVFLFCAATSIPHKLKLDENKNVLLFLLCFSITVGIISLQSTI